MRLDKYVGAYTMEKPLCVNWGFLVTTVQEPFKTVSCRVNRSGLPFHTEDSGGFVADRSKELSRPGRLVLN